MSIVAAELLATVSADTSPADKELRGWTNKLKGGGGPFAGMGAVFGGNLLAGAVSGIGRGIADLGRMGVSALGDMVSSGMEFEAQMDAVSAVLGGTAAEADALGDLAINLAINPNLKVNATEAADAIANLATAGLTAQEILGGATEATILLANATGGEFGQAATVATDVMALFGIEAADMMEAIDGIAGVSNVSKFDLNDYALALSQAGGVASLSGVSFEDFNATIAATAPYFASGSDAGTSFKTFLQRLNPTTAEARDIMNELGLMTEQGTSIFYDSAGSLKDMDSIVAIMNQTFGDMTETQKSFYLGQLFGTDAMRTAGAVSEMTADSYNGLKSAMGETDALDAAKIRTDNFKSALENLQGAFEAVKLKMWDALEPAGQLLMEALSPVIDWAAPGLAAMADRLGAWLTEKIPAVQIAIKTAYDESGGSLFAAAVAGVAELTGLTEELQAFQDFTAGVWSAVSGYVDLAWTVIEPIYDSIEEWVVTTIPPALTSLQTTFTEVWNAIPSALSTAWDAISPVLTSLRTWFETDGIAALSTLRASFEEVWNAIPGFLDTAWATIDPILTSLKTWFETDGVTALTSLQTSFQTVWGNIPSYLTTARDALSTAWTEIVDLFQPSVDRIGEALAGVSVHFDPILTSFSGLKDAVINLGVALTPVLSFIGAAVGVLALLFMNALAPAIDAIGPIVTTMVDQLTLAINSIATVLTGAVELIKGIIAGDWTLVWTSAQTIFTGIWTFIVGTLENLWAVVGFIFAALYDTIVNTLTDLGVDVETHLNSIKTIWDNIWGGFTSAVDTITGIVSDITGAIEGFMDWLRGIDVPNPFAAVADAINAIIHGAPEARAAAGSGGGGGGGGFGGGGSNVTGEPQVWENPGWSGGDQNATGTPLFGGGWSWVGERGPELVRLPRGSRIFDDQTSAAMVGGAVVNNYNTVNNPHDIELIVHRTMQTIARRGR